ncbi:SusC/RagA family TonB-linked outer membrane protein [Algivirga pacifica]|uniref:SusC/RagA family TonB-linked outer membrane protein n=1 Tax=Algivirga pacifica TaxID=1162670 RepID=A0ABP9DJ49_9BACT
MKHIFLMLLLCSCHLLLHAQERRVTGTVADNTGPLPGVSVVLKGTDNGVITNANGQFSVTVPEGVTHLIFRFVGYSTKEIEVGNRTQFDVILVEEAQEMDEVVVTANAIEREKRTLGYAVTSVDGEEFVKAKSPNFVNSLAGKVPGVQVSQASGNLGGSSRIVIRGTSSLSGDNQPLFVVDGVPIGNSNVTTGSGIQGAFDAGNGAGEINPADIASVTVLKGASAAAQYGSRAANGVIIITTKKGSAKRGPVISVNSSARFEEPLRLPNFQNTYGPGLEGKYDVNALNGWGPRIEGQEVPYYNYELDLNDVPVGQWPTETLTAYPDNVKDFYQTGMLFMNTVDVSDATEKGDFRIGITSLNQTGIIPEASLNRYTLAVNAGQRLTKVFEARIGLNYVNSDNRGSATQGGNSPNVLTSIINGIPRTLSLNRLYLNPDGTQDPYGRFSNSPYWIAEKNGNDVEVNRIFGFTQLKATPLDWLNITGRVGLDYRDDERFRRSAVGTLGARDGNFTTDFINSRQLTTSLIAAINKELSESFKLTAIIGHEFNERSFERTTNTAQDLEVPGIYTPSNAVTNTPDRGYSKKRLFGAYADLSLTYNNYLTLNLTGRNDWSSTLPKDNQSYFYPAASVSFIFTDAFQLNSNVLSYGKLRVGAAQVGSDTSPYGLEYRYFPLTNIFGQYGQSNNYPFLGYTSYSGSSIVPPTDLKPERQNSFEIGTELQFFDGRMGLDATVYRISTTDQIINLPVPISTGFAAEMINAGEVRNQGIELLYTITPVKSQDFQWDIQLNFTKNNFKVVSLANGLEKLQMASGFNGISIQAVPGKPLELFGVGFKKHAETGEILVDPQTGLRMVGDNESFGNINPDFIMGLQNSITWKGFTLSGLIDWNHGGVMYSSTVASLRGSGLVEETTVNREGMYLDKVAVIENGDSTTRPNDITVTPQQFWSNYSSGDVAEGAIFSKTFVKFRELRVSYNLPSNWFTGTFIKQTTLGVEGRNLLIIYSAIPHIDPETSLFQASSNASGAVEMGSLPSTRSVGFNLKMTF